MLPSHVEHSSYKRAWLTARLSRACFVLAHAMSAVAARCSLVLQQATDNSPSFR
jgi:hypothetical protein